MQEELFIRWNEIVTNIRESADQAGRDPNQINLIGVSKNHPAEKIELLHEMGLKVFGENRVQELMEKVDQISPEVEWHFIGHLQTNKVKYLLRIENCQLIHSLDNWKLAKEINKRAGKNNRIMPVLIEVNIAGDKNKYGLTEEETPGFIEKVTSSLPNINVKGLMTIVPHTDDPEETRPYFRKMYQLKEKINNHGYNLQELSMGMSNDYRVAVEEGATMVRIGTALFGKREY